MALASNLTSFGLKSFRILSFINVCSSRVFYVVTFCFYSILVFERMFLVSEATK